MSIVAGVAHHLDGLPARRAGRRPVRRAHLRPVPDPTGTDTPTAGTPTAGTPTAGGASGGGASGGGASGGGAAAAVGYGGSVGAGDLGHEPGTARGWRLTRRGRAVVLGFLVALLTAGTVGMGAARALQASTEVPQREVQVVVAEGDTLWTIAAAVAPGDDRQATVERIREANDIRGSKIEPGQQLTVPVAP